MQTATLRPWDDESQKTSERLAEIAEWQRIHGRDGRPSLQAYMNRHGTDKLWIHHYDEEYTRHFDPLRDKPIRLLEIGIGGWAIPRRGGESLKVWRDFFEQGHIAGIDIERKDWLNEERVQTVVCDQSDVGQLEKLNREWGPWDVIIDDGSHIQSHILTSFRTLFPLLNPGGIYVIEDMATAYEPGYGGNDCPLGVINKVTSEETVFELISDLIDGINWQSWKHRTPDDIQRMVKSVHVSRELAFIYKR